MAVGSFRRVIEAIISIKTIGEQNVTRAQGKFQDLKGEMINVNSVFDDFGDRVGNSTKDAKDGADDAAGAFGRMFGIMMSVMFAGMTIGAIFGGISRSMFKFIGVAGPLGTMLKAALLPAFIAMVPLLIKAGEWFMGLNKNTRLLIGAFVLVMAVVGPIIALIGTLGILFTAAGVSAAALGSAIAGVVGIIILISIAVAALLSDEFPWFNNMIDTLIENIVRMGKMFMQVIKGDFKGALDTFLAGWDAALGSVDEWIGRTISNFVDAASNVLDAGKEWASNLIKGFVNWLSSNGAKMVRNALTAIPGIGHMISAGITIGQGLSSFVESVNDFVITSDGRVLRTSPQDTIIGTKQPGNLGGGGNNITVNVNNPELSDRIDIDMLTERVSENIDRQVGGRSRLG